MVTIPVKNDKPTTSVPEDICQAANEAGQKVREFIDHTAHNAEEAGAKVAQQVRANPLTASVAAAGIGFLLGLLFHRR